MSRWMQDAEKTGLLKLLESSEHSAAHREDVLRTKMHLDAIEAQARAAIAEERAAALELAAQSAVKNSRYMLATVVAAGISAVLCALILLIALAIHW